MNEQRHPEILALAVVIIGAFAAITWPPGPSAEPSALIARWMPASSNRDRDVELQVAVTNWRNELARVVDSVYRDAELRSSDDAAKTRLRARARELESVRSQLASRARYLRLRMGLAPAESTEMARLAVLLAASIDQTSEASPEVARGTLDRLEAIAPQAIRVARDRDHEGVLLARHDVQ